MFELKGFDKLQKTLAEAGEALTTLNGQLGKVVFNPDDPASIEKAIEDVERMVDERFGSYSENAVIGPLAEEMKGRYREAILDKAASARLKQGLHDAP